MKLPDDSAFKLEARTSNGRITTDFTGESDSPAKKKKASRSQLSGTFGNGPANVSLNLRTSNGHIDIKHQ